MTQTYRWKVTARVSFPYCFEHGIYKNAEEAKQDAIRDIRENIGCVEDKNDIEISDLKIERLEPVEENDIP